MEVVILKPMICAFRLNVRKLLVKYTYFIDEIKPKQHRVKHISKCIPSRQPIGYHIMFSFLVFYHIKKCVHKGYLSYVSLAKIVLALEMLQELMIDVDDELFRA